MKTPIVQETRRAGHPPAAHRSRQAARVARSLIAVLPSRVMWDERTRTERRRAA